jgi:hypothetical protein
MAKLPSDERGPSPASRALLSAALGGLLAALPACSTSPGSQGDAGSLACEAGVPDGGVVTSSTNAPGLTLEQFTSDCTARGGAVEIEPECGGRNSCRGMSYDTGDGVLTEHTCKGLNTCAGYSCIICD